MNLTLFSSLYHATAIGSCLVACNNPGYVVASTSSTLLDPCLKVGQLMLSKIEELQNMRYKPNYK